MFGFAVLLIIVIRIFAFAPCNSIPRSLRYILKFLYAFIVSLVGVVAVLFSGLLSACAFTVGRGISLVSLDRIDSSKGRDGLRFNTGQQLFIIQQFVFLPFFWMFLSPLV
jgi:hypothetical protein